MSLLPSNDLTRLICLLVFMALLSAVSYILTEETVGKRILLKKFDCLRLFLAVSYVTCASVDEYAWIFPIEFLEFSLEF